MIPGLKCFISGGSNDIRAKVSNKQSAKEVEPKVWLQVGNMEASIQGLPRATDHFLMS